MFRSRRFFLSLLGVVTWSTTAADTVISILDAASLLGTKVSFAGVLIAASALDVVCLCCIGLFSAEYAWKRDGIVRTSSSARRILALSCILPSMAAMVLSLASIITIKIRAKEISSAKSSAAINNWPGDLAPQFAIWGLACLCQIALYTSPIWAKPTNGTEQSVSSSGSRDSVMSEVRTSNQTMNLHMVEATQPASPLALPSPTFSARSSHSLKSWKESLNHVVHPVTSRTKLINRPSFSRDARSIYSDSHSISNVSQPDGFDTWDTSSVDSQARDAVMQSAPPRGTVLGTALEPIPGSRPASPAHALDGPFLEESDGRASPALSLPPKMYPDTSRPPSPAVSEAHIHPLFRTESPVPPPEATPGTSIMASPLSNQVIACPPRPYSRMRSNSRAASPSPLMHSQSFHDRTMNPQRSSRSPSPPSREMTPPIPDFVLTSSPRSSLSGTQTRKKINLYVDTGR
ncbi:uncharacterized protein BDR25DRAFT_123333 [Lindgomyces ingoldianus]|uniref:Uncharacterized protein n=1 Tax=Lindgomyces ingoldianus TaxID=673940 RepID=A0ACB6Q952_9PLEO|nr:uncharacterized protein BDR25DRAFT_123333 [Lindgomyces ingoldianus]KAF2462665.1 hypothetical protein BDR25DRAFT_123333 [Lindgomyces ingoldianus]